MTELPDQGADFHHKKLNEAWKGPYGQFILFGDSLTQQSSSQALGFAFQPALQDAFIRRLDIINRGFSGYNTSQALRILPTFMPKPSQATIRFMLIFFGANDACLPTSSTGQHVPLPIFYNNLKSTILHPSVRSHTHPEYPFLDRQPTKLILVTPPPIDEYQLEDTNPERQRTAEHTKKYADACLELGKEMGVECLNLWGLIMEKAGWKGEGETLVGCKERERSEVLEKLLKDGLHFNPAAYRLLFEALMDLIQEKWPAEYPEDVPFVYPHWTVAPR